MQDCCNIPESNRVPSRSASRGALVFFRRERNVQSPAVAEPTKVVPVECITLHETVKHLAVVPEEAAASVCPPPFLAPYRKTEHHPLLKPGSPRPYRIQNRC